MYGTEISDFLKVVEQVPPGAKVAGLPFDRQSRVMQIESANLGLADYYPAIRPGFGSMVPLLYCGMRHIPCVEKAGSSAMVNPWEPSLPNLGKAFPIFDYFLVRSGPGPAILFRQFLPRVRVLAAQGTWIAYTRLP
jgi:hypothetical protein